MTAPTLPIRTERLLLRPHRIDDLPRFLEAYADPAVCTWLLHEPWDATEAEEQLAKRIRRSDYDGEASALSLAIDVDGVWTGDLALFPVEAASQPRTGELGWVLHPSATGRGHAVEAARALVDVAFGHYALHRVVANLDGRNIASARLCERLGLRREGHHVRDYWSKGEWTDTLVYAVLADEWPRVAPEAG